MSLSPSCLPVPVSTLPATPGQSSLEMHSFVNVSQGQRVPCTASPSTVEPSLWVAPSSVLSLNHRNHSTWQGSRGERKAQVAGGIGRLKWERRV